MKELTEAQLKEKAIECDKALTRGLYGKLALLKEIYDYKLYLYLGYGTMGEYCEKRLNYARSTMFSYLQVANKFLPVIKDPELVQRVGLDKISFRKLIILSNLEHTLLSDLAAKGSIKLKGKAYTIKDLREMPLEALRKLVNGSGSSQPGSPGSVNFLKTYQRAEKFFNKILDDVWGCSDMTEPDQTKIELLINQIAEIFESYKKDIEGVKSIK